MKMYNINTDEMEDRSIFYFLYWRFTKFYKWDLPNFFVANMIKLTATLFGYRKVDMILVEIGLRRKPCPFSWKKSAENRERFIKSISNTCNAALFQAASEVGYSPFAKSEDYEFGEKIK